MKKSQIIQTNKENCTTNCNHILHLILISQTCLIVFFRGDGRTSIPANIFFFREKPSIYRWCVCNLFHHNQKKHIYSIVEIKKEQKYLLFKYGQPLFKLMPILHQPILFSQSWSENHYQTQLKFHCIHEWPNFMLLL